MELMSTQQADASSTAGHLKAPRLHSPKRDPTDAHAQGPNKITKHVEREVICHSNFCHPHVVQFKEIFLTPSHLGIAMEYAPGGDMFQYVKKSNGLKVPLLPSRSLHCALGTRVCGDALLLSAFTAGWSGGTEDEQKLSRDAGAGANRQAPTRQELDDAGPDQSVLQSLA